MANSHGVQKVKLFQAEQIRRQFFENTDGVDGGWMGEGVDGGQKEADGRTRGGWAADGRTSGRHAEEKRTGGEEWAGRGVAKWRSGDEWRSGQTTRIRIYWRMGRGGGGARVLKGARTSLPISLSCA